MATYLFLHGGWSASWVWDFNIGALTEAGHTVHCLDLPGHGSNDSIPLERVTLGDHVKYVETCLKEMEEPVIFVAHSMSGMILSQIAEDMPEKIEKAVYFAAFLPGEDGTAMLKYILEDPWTLVGPETTVTLENGLSDFKKEYLRNVGFNTCSDEAYEYASSRLQLENGFLWTEPVHITERFRSVPKIYIHTLKDNCCTYYMQRVMVKHQPFVAAYSLDTDHFGMISDSEGTNKILLKIAER